MTKKTTQASPKKTGVYKKFITTISILLLVVFSAIGWQAYRIQKQVVTLQNQLQQTQVTLTEQSSAQQALQTSLQQIVKISGYNNAGWVIPEAKYLINLADINLTINKNLPVAIKLLQLADKRIASLHDSALNNLRRTLATDVNTLQAAPQVDTVGLLLQINTINNQITSLAFIPKSPAHDSKSTKQQSEQTKNPTLWQRFYHSTIEALENIVIIRRHDTKIEPLLTETQQTYLMQNIRLHLEQAKWAVLHNHAKTYTSALKQTAKLVKFGFSHNLENAQNILTTLQKLQQINIEPPTPNINGSINALHAAMVPVSTKRISS